MYFKLKNVEDEEDGAISGKTVKYSLYLDKSSGEGNRQGMMHFMKA